MKLGIGSAQFGLNYGISNENGKTPLEEVKEILSFASENKIKLIDTAAAYGNSEEILGECMEFINEARVVTKISGQNMLFNIDSSLRQLKIDKVYGLLLHSFKDLNDATYSDMLKIKKIGKAEKIGVSVYNEDEVEFIMKNYDIDIIQLPLNLFDRRLIDNGQLRKLKNKKIEIHIRSAFLQGLVFMNPSDLPSYFSPIKNMLLDFHKALRVKGISIEAACLCFLKQFNEIDYIICGVNNLEQFKNIFKAFNTNFEDLNFLKAFRIEQENILNPSLWKL